MAKQGAEIINPRTGQRMRFVRTAGDSNGAVLQIDCVSPPSAEREPEHVHPRQENIFAVRSGKLRFRISGVERVLGPGERVVIPPGTPHHFWVEGDEVARYDQEFRPALKTEALFETYFGLAREGKLSARGLPMLAVMSLAFWDEIRLTRPPAWMQRVLFWVLAPVGRALGFRVASL